MTSRRAWRSWSSPTTAPTCWSGCSSGLDALDRAAGRGDRRRQRQHRPHPRRPRAAPTLPGAIRSDREPRRGGRLPPGACKAAYEQGFDRIWLMDDDVVPAPDCLGVLLAQDEDCLTAVREDQPGRPRREGRRPVRPRSPLAISPKTASVDSAPTPTRASMPETVPLENVVVRGLPGPARGGRRDRPARPDVLHLLRRRATTRSAPGAPASRSSPCATPCSCASSTSTSSTTSPAGRATTCTATCSRCIRYGENALVRAQAVADRPRGGAAESAAGRAQRGAERGASPQGCAGDAAGSGSGLLGLEPRPAADPVAGGEPASQTASAPRAIPPSTSTTKCQPR